ncbi:MAG: hypothetical protein MZV70_18440 [Desulfobacterales bacterium]|nr:hypothetical protein [Desulfobacterales bacterium]
MADGRITYNSRTGGPAAAGEEVGMDPREELRRHLRPAAMVGAAIFASLVLYLAAGRSCPLRPQRPFRGFSRPEGLSSPSGWPRSGAAAAVILMILLLRPRLLGRRGTGGCPVGPGPAPEVLHRDAGPRRDPGHRRSRPVPGRREPCRFLQAPFRFSRPDLHRFPQAGRLEEWLNGLKSVSSRGTIMKKFLVLAGLMSAASLLVLPAVSTAGRRPAAGRRRARRSVTRSGSSSTRRGKMLARQGGRSSGPTPTERHRPGHAASTSTGTPSRTRTAPSCARPPRGDDVRRAAPLARTASGAGSTSTDIRPRRRHRPQARPSSSSRPDGQDDPDDQTVARVLLPGRRPAGGERPPADGVPEQGPPDRGPLRLLQELLLHRPVVPQARRLRGGQGLELPRLPSELASSSPTSPISPSTSPSRADTSSASSGKADRRADRRVGRHGHDHLPPGHGPRLRLDGRPPLPQDRARFRRRPGGDPAGVRARRPTLLGLPA